MCEKKITSNFEFISSVNFANIGNRECTVQFKALLTWADILSLHEKSKYWKLDIKGWLIVCFHTSPSRVIQSYRESPFLMKCRSKFNIDHSLFRHKLFQTPHSLDGYYYLILWFLKVLRPNPNNVTCVQPKAYDLFVAHHKYVSVHPGSCSAYDYNISCCLQARNYLNNIFTRLSGTFLSKQYKSFWFIFQKDVNLA